MSRSEKSKGGTRPIKLPAAIFEQWHSIVEANNDALNEWPTVKDALVNLVSSANDSWERQAGYLKETSRAMGRLDKKPGALIMNQVIEPIVSSGYFCCTENLARRHFIPLLETCAKQNGNNNETFIRLYEEYIRLDQQNREHTMAQSALTITATLEFGYGRRVVLDHYRATIAFLIAGLKMTDNKLKAIIAPTSNTTPSSANNTLTVSDLMYDIQYMIKTIHILLSRFDDYGRKLFATLDDTCDEDMKLISTLLNITFNMAAETDVYVKDCSQGAGMAVGAVINLIQDPAFARDLTLGWFFTRSDQQLEACTRTTQALDVAPKATLIGDNGWKNRAVPMLSIVRGLMSCLRQKILLASFSSELSFIGILKSGAPFQNLFEVLFYSINLFCSRTDLEAPIKVVAFDSMVMWLSSCKTMMRLSLNDQGQLDQQMVTSASAILNEDNTDQLIHYVWDHWDDPIDAIQHKVKTIFETTLDILEVKAQYANTQDAHKEYLLRLLRNLMRMDAHRKVKYALLNILVPKVGSDAILDAEPDFMWKCMRAMDSLVLSPQITGLILAFLYRRIEETMPGVKFKGQNTRLQENEDTKPAISNWIELWAPSVLRALTSSSEVLRKNNGSFVLQPLFKICKGSFWYLMERLQSDAEDPVIDPKWRLHAFIAVLKVGRSLDIVDGDAYVLDKSVTDPRKISVDTLNLAVYHADPLVRLDVLGLLCESRKGTSTITKVEMDILRKFIPLNMNSTSPEFRQMFCAYLSRLFLRMRGNLYAQFRNYKASKAYVAKMGQDDNQDKVQKAELEAMEMRSNIEHGKSFLYWLQDLICTSLYPGASYQRVATALRLLSIMISTFGVTELPMPDGFATRPEFPFQIPIGTPRMTKVLIDTLMNPYDFNRVQALEILHQFPNPLPGVESWQEAQHLLWWGLDNVTSTRAGESDSGAMVFRLIFNKYVMQLGYDLYPERNSRAQKDTAPELAPVVFTERLLDLLVKQVEAAKDNLLVAAQQHPMHGTLLALQYVFRELDYRKPAVIGKFDEWKLVHARALKMIHAVCDAVMDVLSNPSPEGNVPSSFREMEEAIDDLIDDEDDGGEGTGPKHQVILSCCWRAVKEASSLLEVIISRAPMSDDGSAIITSTDMKESGVLLRSLLTTIRHRGAFSAVFPAYVSLNTRLLDSNDRAITQQPSVWLEENLDSLTASNISITRRSAGLPLCILAIVSSERSTKKTLLNKTMQRLFKLAFQEPPADADQRIDLPQVHAYNILRTMFMDAKVAQSVLIYAADGFCLAINGFSSSSWAIRNCAVMLFSTLLQRTFGTKKTKDEHSNVNKLTGREFFTRYPQLHAYLLQELNAAIEQLLNNTAGASVHPGLYPILTLLSRLHPSVMDGSDQVTAMSAFVPLVMTCAVSSIYKTREMAARALVPLIPSSDLVERILELLDMPQDSYQNEIHGRLLQVQFLLRGHAYHPSLKDILTDLIKRVPAAIAILLQRSKSMNRVAYALLLDICNEFFFECDWMRVDREPAFIQELECAAKTELQTLRTTLIDQSMEQISKPRGPPTLIGNFLARQSMARIIVISALKHYYDSLKVSDTLFLLDDPDYEVRLMAMNLLEQHLDRENEKEGVVALYRRLLIKTFEGEDNLNCFVLAARSLLSLKQSESFQELGLEFSYAEYWNRLLEQFENSRSQSVTEVVLPLLGSLLSKILEQENLDSQWIASCITVWSRHVVDNSHKEVTLPLREAAVESIGFMAKYLFNRVQASPMVHVQLAITQLLQDDDIDIREITATIVSEALAQVAPVSPERAIELVYTYLSTSNEYRDEIQSMLLKHLQGEQDLPTICKEELSLVKALFAKENPNIYKEDIIDVQWTFVDLDRFTVARAGIELPVSFISKTLEDIHYLCTLLKDKSLELMTRGPYGVSSKPGIFLAAYRALLTATLAFSVMPEEEKEQDGILKLVQALDVEVNKLVEESMHPLLWKLIHGEAGLASKIDYYLRQHGHPRYRAMFLLSPDSQ